MVKKLLLIVVVFVLCIAWSSDPTPVCRPFAGKMVAAGSGGVIIAWVDNSVVYMQRLSDSGAALWGANGKVIYSGNRQRISYLVANGSGGVLFAVGSEVEEYSNIYSGYVKRVNSQGNVVWTSNMISDSMPTPSTWRLVFDGSGGVFIFWAEDSGSETKIQGQHIDSNGSTMWTAGGIPVSSIEGDQYYPGHAVSDGQGGTYVAWVNWRDYPISDDLFIQRIDSSGNRLWGQEGILVNDEPDIPYSVRLYSAGQNGVYVSRGRWRHEIHMHRFDSAGNRLWAADGVLVYRNQYYYYNSSVIDLVTDKVGGFYMLIGTSYTDLWGYAEYEAALQHIDSSGNTAWGMEGITIIRDRVYFRDARMIDDGAGKAIVVWKEENSGSELLKTQLVDAAGTFRWSDDGVTVSDAISRNRSFLQTSSNEAGGAIVAWSDGKAFYAQNICASGGIGTCVVPIAVIEASRSGGVAPVTITFDGSSSYDPDGKVKQWKWNLGDGATASTPKVTHTYNNTGTYDVTLRVKDDSWEWSKTVKKRIKIFSLDALDAVFDFYTGPIKSKNRGYAMVRASLFDKPYSEEERALPGNLGLTFAADKGSWQGDIAFGSGVYSRALSAETNGTATISAVLEGKVLATAEVTFAWLLPPAAVTVNLQANRSLFRGEYNAHISWSANPEEVFTPAKYRVYISTGGGAFELAAEVEAGVFSYVDEHLPAGRQYSFAVSMVDDMGDESDLSTASLVNR